MVYDSLVPAEDVDSPRVCTGMACTAFAVIECVPYGGSPCQPDAAQNIGTRNTGGCGCGSGRVWAGGRS